MLATRRADVTELLCELKAVLPAPWSEQRSTTVDPGGEEGGEGSVQFSSEVFQRWFPSLVSVQIMGRHQLVYFFVPPVHSRSMEYTLYVAMSRVQQQNR